MELRYDPIHPDPSQPGTGDTDKTPNYQLLLNRADTITSWLTIFNVNMTAIDIIMHNLALRTSINGEVPPEAINDIIKLNEQVAALQDQVKQIPLLAEQLANLTTTVNTNSTDINTLKINFTNADTQIATINVRLAGLQESVEKCQMNIATLNDTLTDVQNSLTSLEARVKALEDKEVS